MCSFYVLFFKIIFVFKSVKFDVFRKKKITNVSSKFFFFSFEMIFIIRKRSSSVYC